MEKPQNPALRLMERVLSLPAMRLYLMKARTRGGAHAKLGRKVAIKILPDTVAHDQERLARFDFKIL